MDLSVHGGSNADWLGRAPVSGGIVGDFKLVPGGEVPVPLTLDAVRRHVEEHGSMIVFVTITPEGLNDYLAGKSDSLARTAWATGVESSEEMDAIADAWRQQMEVRDARHN